MAEFWNRLVPAAVLGLVISFFGFSVLTINLGDTAVLLTRDTAFEMTVIVFISSIVGGAYLSSKEEEYLFRDGLALGALIDFGELVIVVSMLHNFIGNWQLSMVHSISFLAVFFFIGAVFGSVIGVFPKYFLLHFRRVE